MTCREKTKAWEEGANPGADDQSLAWKELKCEHLVRDRWIDFRRLTYEMPDGTVFEPYYSYSRRSYVVIVATDEEEKLPVRERIELKDITYAYPGTEKLIFDRADAANREVQIRLLLELVDIMKETREAKYGMPSKEKRTAAEKNPACFDSEDFFRRTKYTPESGVIGEDGKVQRFSNDMVIRYLESIDVQEDGYAVHLKAGITVNVALKK